jgi:hypothetical protein
LDGQDAGMRIRFAIAIAAQLAAYLFLACCLLAMFGILRQLSPAQIAALAVTMVLGGLIPLFLNCEKCGVSYFWHPRAAAKHAGGMNLKPGYNMLVPVSAHCRNCGLGRS